MIAPAQFTLDAMKAVPKDTALPTSMTKPTLAQFTYGKMITGRPTVLSTNMPEAARMIPAYIRPNTLNIGFSAEKSNNTIQAKNF